MKKFTVEEMEMFGNILMESFECFKELHKTKCCIKLEHGFVMIPLLAWMCPSTYGLV